jgi:hypothetical protein
LGALPTGVRTELTITASRMNHLGICNCNGSSIRCLSDKKETARKPSALSQSQENLKETEI